MNTFKQQLQKPALLGAGAFLAGVLLGWLLLGWVLFPVKYVDGDPSQLRSDFQQDYVKAAADSYLITGSGEDAQRRLASLGESAGAALETAKTSANGDELFRLQSFEAIAGGPVSPVGEEPATGGEAGSAAGNSLRLILPACGIVLFLGLAAAGALFLRSRLGSAARRPPLRPPPVMEARPAQARPEAGHAQAQAAIVEEPITRFMTTYKLGDDQYDDSFSIDAPSGDFMGECGVGISETIGVGDPKKVTAFEVWLFDKNDIRTVTRVLMSEHAFGDEALKSRLAAKGEPVLALPGEVVNMETASLLVTARVVDIAYGGGALPPSSFFEQITIELAAYPKP